MSLFTSALDFQVVTYQISSFFFQMSWENIFMTLRQYLWHALFQQRQISNPPMNVSDPSLPVSNLVALQANQLLYDSSPLPSSTK